MISKDQLKAIGRRSASAGLFSFFSGRNSKESRREYWEERVGRMTDAEIAKIPRDELPRVDGILQRRMNGLIDLKLEGSDKQEKANRDRDRIETVVDATSTASPATVDLGSASAPRKNGSGKNPNSFQSQEFNGHTLDELLAMRDYKRDRIPDAYTVKEWRAAVRKEIQRWAVEATKPNAARGAQPADPADHKPASKPATRLSDDDLNLLISGSLRAIADKETFRRYTAMKAGRHPDTDEPIDVNAETARAKESKRKGDHSAVTDATYESESTGRDLSPEGIAAAGDGSLPNRKETALDAAQMAGDAVGVVDPTGIVDGVNAVVSVARAIREPERRGEHLKNAAISAVSMIPYIGDTAKLAKTGSFAKTIRNGAKLSDAKKAGKGFGAIEKGIAGMLSGSLSGGGSGDDGGGGAAPPASPSPGGEDPRDRSADAIEDEIEGREKSKKSMEDFTEKLIDWTFGLAKVIGSVIGILEGSRLLNKGVLYSNQHLSNFNPTVANAYAQREIATTRRNIREADQLADPLSEAAQADILADDVRSEIMTPLKGIFTDLEATATKFQWGLIGSINNLTGFSKGLETVQSGLDKMTDFFESFTGALGLGGGNDPVDDRDNDTRWGRFLDDISDGKFDDETARDRFFEEWNGDGKRDERRRRRERRA